MQPLAPFHRPHLEAAGDVLRVAHALQQAPVPVHAQLQLLVEDDLQAVDRDRVLVVVRPASSKTKRLTYKCTMLVFLSQFMNFNLLLFFFLSLHFCCSVFK